MNDSVGGAEAGSRANDVDAAQSVAHLKRWVVEEALPLWGETGFDAARGSFVERLTFEGSPLLSAPRRAMVQARQIFMETDPCGVPRRWFAAPTSPRRVTSPSSISASWGGVDLRVGSI